MRPSVEDDLLSMNGRKPAGRGSRAVRRASGRKPFRPWRFLVRAVLSILVAGVVWHGLSAALQPHCLTWLTRRAMVDLVRRQQAADRAREELEWLYIYSGSEKGAENLLRDFGFVRHNEIPFIVPGQNAPARPPASPAKDSPSLWDRTMLLICRMCGVDPGTIG